MSHFTTIKTQIKDLQALAAAVLEIGQGARLEVTQPGKKITARGWAGRTMDCDAVIRMPGAYDVALTRQKDGTFATDADYYDGSIEAIMGEKLGKLNQYYGIHKVTQLARKQGKQVQRLAGKNGAINVRILGA